MAKSLEEFQVIFKLRDQTAGGFKAVNALRVAESLKSIGEELNAWILSNGALFVNCKSAEQLGKAKKIGKVTGKKVEVVIPEKNNVTKGLFMVSVLTCQRRKLRIMSRELK